MSQIPGTPDDVAAGMDIFDVDRHGDVGSSNVNTIFQSQQHGQFELVTWIDYIPDLMIGDIEFFGIEATQDNRHCMAVEYVVAGESHDVVVIWEGHSDITSEELSAAFETMLGG
jgi:hypothetical protein